MHGSYRSLHSLQGDNREMTNHVHHFTPDMKACHPERSEGSSEVLECMGPIGRYTPSRVTGCDRIKRYFGISKQSFFRKFSKKQPISLDSSIQSFYIWFVRLKDQTNHWGGSSILVRAPACHAGGCEFKPRLSRDKALLFEKCFSFWGSRSTRIQVSIQPKRRLQYEIRRTSKSANQRTSTL